jgi:tRNA threonylcarbamoyladenosine biosynthesis protein TsaB
MNTRDVHPMVILALDTTTRAGSVTLMRDNALLDLYVGAADRTHATRLPGDLTDRLALHGLELQDVDLFAVAAGPGSFTGLRIGIATVQGLAFATGRPVAGVSALDALAEAARQEPAVTARGATHLVAAWMDAQRGEVYAALYRTTPDGCETIDPPRVGTPTDVLAAWAGLLDSPEPIFIGGGALVYREVVDQAYPSAVVIDPTPPLTPAIATLAGRQASADLVGPPHAVKPLYVRRPDAELARDRRKAATAHE